MAQFWCGDLPPMSPPPPTCCRPVIFSAVGWSNRPCIHTLQRAQEAKAAKSNSRCSPLLDEEARREEKGSDSWSVRYVHGSGETCYIPNAGEVMWIEKREAPLLHAKKETGFALSVVAFNEILCSRTRIYCKLLLLRLTSEVGGKTWIVLPTMWRHFTFLFTFLVLHISFMHMLF